MARFPRRARLLEPQAFKAVFAEGKRISLSGLTAIILPNTLGHPRLGLAIAKKSVRKAVDRNRIKRCVRDSFRLQQAAIVPVDIVVLARPRLELTPNAALRMAMGTLWQRLAAT